MSMISKLLKRKAEPAIHERVEVVNSTAAFTAWGGDPYANDIYRGAVDSVARNVGKLRGGCVIKHQDRATPDTNSRLNRLLQEKPNEYMSAYDMLYKLTTHYYMHSNAFAYLDKDSGGNVCGIYPIGALGVEFVANTTGELYCRFCFHNGQQATLAYRDIIHLRRFFNGNDLLGDDNSAISPTLEVADVQAQGIATGIKTAANIRGILKYTQIMSPEKLKEEKDRFIHDYLSISNEGGVIATDQKYEYVPISINPATIDHEQLSAIKTRIYSYLGIHESIVSSSYTEDEWAAFYESVIEPIALQLSLEFTNKVFTDRERAFGNMIMFESGRLQFSSNSTKVNLIKELVPYGLLTINQALEILNLPSVADGDRRLQTLNVVDAERANQYQLGGGSDGT